MMLTTSCFHFFLSTSTTPVASLLSSPIPLPPPRLSLRSFVFLLVSAPSTFHPSSDQRHSLSRLFFPPFAL